MLQKLRSSQLLSIAQFDDFGNILYHINHFHLFVKLKSVLRIITETNCFANIHCSAIRLDLSHQYLDKSRFSGSVISYNSHLLITREDIREIIQNLQISETLEKMVGFEYLASDIRCFHFQLYIISIKTLLRNLFQFVESIFPVTSLMSACLRHPAHPVEFCTIQIIGTLYFHALRFNTFLTLFEIIAVVTFILVDLLIVYFDNLGANTIKEVTVVSHHQQAKVGTTQVIFQPFGHIQVQMVGRLIKD